MDSKYSHVLYAPPTPVSPGTPVLDSLSEAPRQNEPSTWCRARTPMSPESMHGIDVAAENRYDAIDSRSFERALLNMAQDRKRYSATESKHRGHGNISMTKNQPTKMSPPSSMKISRDSSKLQADTKRGGRPPPSLAATHPALYTRPSPTHQRKMLPTPPPLDYPKHQVSFQPSQVVYDPPSPSPPWRTYTDPNRQVSGEPNFDDPKYRMLKMDLEPCRPKVLSPTFMIALPCGSMIEAANQYPDARPSHFRHAPNA